MDRCPRAPRRVRARTLGPGRDRRADRPRRPARGAAFGARLRDRRPRRRLLGAASRRRARTRGVPGGPLQHGDARDRRRGLGSRRRPLGRADAGGPRHWHVLPGHHLVPHVLLGAVRPDGRGRAPAPHRPAQADRLVLPAELRASARDPDGRDGHRLPVAARQPRVARGRAARGVVHRAPLRGRHGDPARRCRRARLRDVRRLAGRKRAERHRRALLSLMRDRVPGERRGHRPRDAADCGRRRAAGVRAPPGGAARRRRRAWLRPEGRRGSPAAGRGRRRARRGRPARPRGRRLRPAAARGTRRRPRDRHQDHAAGRDRLPHARRRLPRRARGMVEGARLLARRHARHGRLLVRPQLLSSRSTLSRRSRRSARSTSRGPTRAASTRASPTASASTTTTPASGRTTSFLRSRTGSGLSGR